MSKTAKTADAIGLTVAPAKAADFQQDVTITKPEIWDLDHPSLYSALVKVKSGKDMIRTNSNKQEADPEEDDDVDLLETIRKSLR